MTLLTWTRRGLFAAAASAALATGMGLAPAPLAAQTAPLSEETAPVELTFLQVDRAGTTSLALRTPDMPEPAGYGWVILHSTMTSRQRRPFPGQWKSASTAATLNFPKQRI